ncbi:hypothetical protein AU197_09620 [Mycobacterium sp. IS-1590]|uniref:hypothetical protein n=1 Tax=Mycobacterium sp. IS-1590 TaxID=1772286 RepID=UPI0007485096|nr:hypothetical protein [Mycobacterium sp. IS-1590]KUI37979.1 hypothetical protein AU197_09620 [Mycobacterium sp. IS-1590]
MAGDVNDPVTTLIEYVSFAVEPNRRSSAWKPTDQAPDGEAVISLTSDTAVSFWLPIFSRPDVVAAELVAPPTCRQ